MAIKYLYKCNPLVAKEAGVTSFDRYTWPDGTFLLWESDMIAIDRDRYFLDREGFLADYGIVRMSDPQAAEEQRNPSIRLPEARKPQFRWEQPSMAEDEPSDDIDAESAPEQSQDQNEEGGEE